MFIRRGGGEEEWHPFFLSLFFLLESLWIMSIDAIRKEREKKKMKEEKGWKWRMNTKSRRRWEYFSVQWRLSQEWMHMHKRRLHNRRSLTVLVFHSFFPTFYLNVSLDFFLVTKERSFSSLRFILCIWMKERNGKDRDEKGIRKKAKGGGIGISRK